MKISLKVALLALNLAAGLHSQISQNHPEFCGDSHSNVQLPPGVSGLIDPANGSGKLIVRTKVAFNDIAVPGMVSEFQQLCPLGNGRLVVFASNGAGENVVIVDGKNGSRLDSFDGGFAILSPNQRWIAFTKFYPRGMEEPYSDEYLLYDLSRTAGENRGPGVSSMICGMLESRSFR
jgi:hypothetical protein